MSQIEPNKEFEGPAHLSDMDRRDFLKYMGLFSTMTFLSNCTRPAQNILPMPREIEEYSTRSYEFYTSAFSSNGFSQGIKVKCFQGRPIKIEGNENHPYSFGATTAQAQALLYDLYHPGRNQKIQWRGKEKKLSEFPDLMKDMTSRWGKGEEVGFIFPAQHSPFVNQLIDKIQEKYPESKWISLSPYKQTAWNLITELNQDVVISFDEDAFFHRPDAIKLSREFMKRRERAITSNNKEAMNELYVYESSPTLMGAKADSRVNITREEIWNDAVDLMNIIAGNPVMNERMQKLYSRIKGRRAIVFLNNSLDPEAKNLEQTINQLLKVDYQYLAFEVPETHMEADFVKLLKNKKIKTLFILESDPVYWNQSLRSLIEGVPEKISLSLFPNESHDLATIKIAQSHPLESWGDLRAIDGSITIQQPLIEPIYTSLSLPQVLLGILGETKTPLTLLKETYQSRWEEGLQKGWMAGETNSILAPLNQFPKRKLTDGFNIKLVPDPTVGYGEFANNPIMQELPKPFSKLTWSNAFYISPEDAEVMKLKTGDVIKVKSKKVGIKGPVWVLPGVARETIIATYGYGQQNGTFVAKKRGYSAYAFEQDEAITLEKTSGYIDLASTHGFQMLPEKHSPVKHGRLPLGEKEPKIKVASLYPEHPIPIQEKGPQWGMTIDLTTCIGCQSCVSACQVENNVPFVGEDQVRQDRILHWLRVDTYFNNGQAVFQPIPCMHCEKAPCEVVCPVNATVHGNSGLNEMIYNRCVGTRYCSNNCPYKVRRFNFKAYSVMKKPWNMGFNPDVSVRERGVMEKCTFCIQRQIKGEGKTACQVACPTEAITFGDIKDDTSLVTRKKNLSHNYDLLEDEGTVPRTSYLKVIRYEA
ncbi:4Fe-4S dicluster domain-containing protein [Peredibacter starrii]|uniref:4Fe-4S dicluster domain-containing protein n=1 Tax=Peredibacter starrii TaxID=28202 RepID=A0AAX4HS64_9BACT|nr:4Fe-4S dicluster domain-containing protein [Peredibacter starrii]WPU66071.1 4Fe-4S dicluster domain-containing protein [Peredibacter starrii]